MDRVTYFIHNTVIDEVNPGCHNPAELCMDHVKDISNYLSNEKNFKCSNFALKNLSYLPFIIYLTEMQMNSFLPFYNRATPETKK